MDKRFEQVYREHSKFVYNVALGMLRNKTEAEDIMQSVFIKLFSNYDAFRGESAIRTYLYRMTVNKCLDLFRLRKIREAKHEQMGLPEQRNTAAANELYSLMEKLDPDLKAPILLSEIGGFSYKEIGEILGINLGTVKSRIHRGMNKLRQEAKKEALT